eukprot:Sdes_comp16955_c0_seq1m6160
MFLLTYHVISKMDINSLGGLVPKNSNSEVDGFPFVIGIATFLRHCHSSHPKKYMWLISKFLGDLVSQSDIDNRYSSKVKDLLLFPAFFRDYSKCGKLEASLVHSMIPQAYLNLDFIQKL